MQSEIMLCLIALLSLGLVLGDVLKFQPSNYIPASKFGRQVRLTDFKFKNCGDKSKDLFVISSLDILPDPVQFPGTFTISFSGVAKKTISSPVPAEVKIAKKEGDKYLDLPCIQGVGSCNYSDVCALLAQIGTQCPDPLVEAGIPCQCPYNAGSYKLESAAFNVGSALLPTGDYMASINMTSADGHVGCYEINVTLS
ncbi:ganglioside GM2 activator [Patella vulgata]|uniref:ganglioside GM2 activator n=1 Tax=Patella vulgata TaxID=6465 RepID=UPI00217F56D7|nr:ganglioside GM2 activator [Patella vulgata]